MKQNDMRSKITDRLETGGACFNFDGSVYCLPPIRWQSKAMRTAFNIGLATIFGSGTTNPLRTRSERRIRLERGI